MTTKIFKHHYPWLKFCMVSDSTDTATCWSEIEAAVNANLPITPFVINPVGMCPMQLLTVSEYEVMAAVPTDEIDEAQAQAIADAYQAANP